MNQKPSTDSGIPPNKFEMAQVGRSKLYRADCLDWLPFQAENSFHAVVTDPPFSGIEYTVEELKKLKSGKGGIWRIPPTFDGKQRAPVPRFTVLSDKEVEELYQFFQAWATLLLPTLVPGGYVMVASSPLLSPIIGYAIWKSGFERRGEIIRLVQTLRGGDRPKGAHKEFSDISVMPRSQHEPWLLFRKPFKGRVQDNLRERKTGGLRRISADQPFGDVIRSSSASKLERKIINHPNLKPQAFLRQVVRAILPMEEGIVLDTFAGSGSTLAAAEALGYESIGLERDPEFFSAAAKAIGPLSKFQPPC